MKRLFKRLLCLALVAVLLSLPVLAADQSAILDEQAQKSGASDLAGKTPSAAKGALPSLGVKGADPKGMSGLSISSVFGFVWQKVKDTAEAPFRAVAAVLGILLLCALADAMKNAFAEKAAKTAFDVVSALAIAAVLIGPISRCITAVADAVRNSAIFLTAFVPVFAGLAAASGHPASAVAMQGGVLLLAQVITQVASTTFVPMVGIFLAFCVIGSISPSVSIAPLASFAKKVVTVGLTFALTIFSAVLTIQGFISQAADTVAMKTAKFVVSGAVPVVGGAISDALGTVVSCAGLLKSAVGAYAIVVFLVTYLPVVLECMLWLLALELALALSGMVGAGSAPALLKGMRDALQMLLALVAAAALAMIVSICIMLLVSGQAA